VTWWWLGALVWLASGFFVAALFHHTEPPEQLYDQVAEELDAWYALELKEPRQ